MNLFPSIIVTESVLVMNMRVTDGVAFYSMAYRAYYVKRMYYG